MLKKMTRLMLAAAAMVAFTTPVLAGTVTMIYSGNLDGELEPCGCSADGNFGGILRRATTLQTLREKHADLLVVSAGGLLSGGSPQDRVKNDYILSGFKQLNYDAIAVQWADLIYGEEFIGDRSLPLVASNYLAKTFSAKKLIERGGEKVMFFSWLDPEESPLLDMGGEHQPVEESSDKLLVELKEAKSQKALTVLSTSLPLLKAKKTLPLELVDILIIQAAYEVYGDPVQDGNTLILEPGSRGMRLGKLALTVANGQVAKWQHEVIAMPNTVKDADSMQAWYDDYSTRLREDYEKRSALRKAMDDGQSPYAGAKVCAQCHESQYDVWRSSEHAKALYDLEDVNKEFDGFCVGCHVVGFDKKGGFVDGLLTPHLAGVQCENCHGAAAEHVKSKGKVAVENEEWDKQKICQQCHVQKHSPTFDMKKYWPKIAH